MRAPGILLGDMVLISKLFEGLSQFDLRLCVMILGGKEELLEHLRTDILELMAKHLSDEHWTLTGLGMDGWLDI